MYKYLLTKEARHELDKEFEYSEKGWGRQHAQKYFIALKAKLEAIARNPFIYQQRNDIIPGIRICAYKGNRIIFTILEERKQVVVVGFLSVHQDINQLQDRVIR